MRSAYSSSFGAPNPSPYSRWLCSLEDGVLRSSGGPVLIGSPPRPLI